MACSGPVGNPIHIPDMDDPEMEVEFTQFHNWWKRNFSARGFTVEERTFMLRHKISGGEMAAWQGYMQSRRFAPQGRK